MGVGEREGRGKDIVMVRECADGGGGADIYIDGWIDRSDW